MQVIERRSAGPPPSSRSSGRRHDDRGCHGPRCGTRMVGRPGWEFFGAWDDEEAVYEALVQAMMALGLRLAGGRASRPTRSSPARSRSPLPAGSLAPARRRTGDGCPRPVTGVRVDRGSFVSVGSRTTSYAVGPRLRSLRRFRPRLRRAEGSGSDRSGEHRRKIALTLDDEDMSRTIGTMFPSEGRAKPSTGRRRILDAPVRPREVEGETSMSPPGSGLARTRGRY